jgi:hypothetical protein
MDNKRPLHPRDVINVEGKLIYCERDQAWNLLRLKKEVLNEFYQLKEMRSKFSYHMVYYRTYEELEKAVKELKKKGELALPFLVFLYKDEEKGVT